MRKWLIEHFLPMWAKQTVLADNRALLRKNRELQRENRELHAYIRGLENGLQTVRRVTIHNHGGEK